MARAPEIIPHNNLHEGPDQLPPPSRALSHLKEKVLATHSEGAKARAITKLLRKALEALRVDDYAACCQLALDALDKDETHSQANHIMAVALERLGELSKAVTFYERALKFDPNDNEIYFNLSLVAWRLKMLPAAERLSRIYLERVPNRAEGYNNLAGVLRDKGQFDDSIELLRTAIFQYPEEPQLWNTLGVVLMETGRFSEAKAFIEEAIRLDNKFARAHHNLGFLLNHTGPIESALKSYDTALELTLSPGDRAEVENARAICLFHLGRIEEGFKLWHVRTEYRYIGAPLYGFDLPEWQDEPLAGKTVLLVAEQGLGDEIMFGQALPEVIDEIGPDGRALIACEKRLVSLFERSFPSAKVGAYADRSHNARPLRFVPWLESEGHVDYWAPFGTTLQFRRKRVEDFAGKAALLKADPARVAHWRGRLETLGPGPYIGLCWKSLVMDAKRSKFYSPIPQWEPVLTTPGACFVNLQYGDCAADIKKAEEMFGIKIHNFDDINLKNDLDDNAALCSALDLVITAPNAASAVAGGVGTEVWFITLCEVWPQLGTKHMPWYPKTRVFTPAVYGDFPEALGRAGAALRERIAQRPANAA